MCGGLKKRYILTALVCFGAVMSGGGFVQAESTTAESRSETRTTVDRNGTIAERVRRTESRTTVSSETKDSDAIRNMAAEQRRQMERMGLPHTGDRAFNEKVEYQYESGVVLNELLAPLVVPNRNVPKSIGTWAGMTFQNDRIIEQGILAKCKSGGKWGILGTDGKELIAPAYKEILDVNDRTGVIHVMVDKKTTRFISKTGEQLTPEAADESDRRSRTDAAGQEDSREYYDSDGYTSFKEKGKYGFKDGMGKVVISPRYKDVIAEFSEDRAFVKNEKGKIVAVDGSGRELFQAPSNQMYAYEGGLAEYRRKVGGFNVGSLLGFVTGGLIYGGFGYNGIGLGGFTYDGAKRGYIDRDGNIVIDSKNDKVWPMTWYGTVIKNDRKTGFVNRKGEYVIRPGDYDVGDLDEINGLLVLKDGKTGKSGIFSVETGQQVIPFRYDGITFAGSDRLVVEKNGVRSLYNMRTGYSVFSVSTDMTIDPFLHDRLTWVHQGSSNYEVINDQGQILFADKEGLIEEARPFSHGYSAVKAKGKWGIMGASGKWLVQPVYQDLDIL